jgi:hypothetical protein
MLAFGVEVRYCARAVLKVPYGASKTGIYLAVRGEILEPLLVKNAPDIFTIK